MDKTQPLSLDEVEHTATQIANLAIRMRRINNKIDKLKGATKLTKFLAIAQDVFDILAEYDDGYSAIRPEKEEYE